MWFKKFIRLSWELKRNIKRNWKSLKKFDKNLVGEECKYKNLLYFFYPFFIHSLNLINNFILIIIWINDDYSISVW